MSSKDNKLNAQSIGVMQQRQAKYSFALTQKSEFKLWLSPTATKSGSLLLSTISSIEGVNECKRHMTKILNSFSVALGSLQVQD